MISQLNRYAGWSAYVSAVATILGFVFIVIFFAIGQPFGTLNDFFGSVILALSMMPVAVALHQILRSRTTNLSRLALFIGLGAMAVFAFASTAVILHTFGIVTFVEPRPGTGPFGLDLYAPGVIGVWLLLIGYLSIRHASFPKRLGWMGVIAGAGYVVSILGFALGGPEHPLVAVGGLAGAIAYPIWAIWLGRVLMSSKVA